MRENSMEGLQGCFVVHPAVFQLMPENTARSRLHHRKYTTQNAQFGFSRKVSSGISEEDIKKWFNPIIDPVPITSSITGRTWQEVLRNMLKPMSPAGLPCDLKEVQCILEEVPDTIKEECTQLTETICAILSEAQVDGVSNIANLWKKMLLFISQTHCDGLAKYTSGVTCAKRMLLVLNIIRWPHEYNITESKFTLGHEMYSAPDKQILHLALAELWRSILIPVVENGVQEEKSAEHNIYTSADYMHNGLAHADVKIVGKTSVTCIACTPDMMILRHKLMEPLNQMLFAEIAEWPVIVGEVKSTMTETDSKNQHVANHASGTESFLSSSEAESTGSRSASKDVHAREKHTNKPRECGKSCQTLKDLKTQHFMQLIGSMMPGCRNSVPRERCFGLYFSMNKIYITSLFVQPCTELDVDEASGDVLTTKYDLFWSNLNRAIPSKEFRLRMISNGYLDVFDPLHFRAFISYLQLLVWHEPGTTDIKPLSQMWDWTKTTKKVEIRCHEPLLK